jgi:pimeloyl-ACP methyl ester carboxylesterase
MRPMMHPRMIVPKIRHAIAAAVLLGLAPSPVIAQTKEPINLRDVGSFHIGGRLVDIGGKPVREVSIGGATQRLDPNGTYLVEQMYVQYLLPQNRRGKVPLLMWHGGGFTGVSYESTPDGREGWLNMFVRKGWDTYVSDAVERGRAGWAMPEVFKGEPVFLPVSAPWSTWRFGDPGTFDPDPAKRMPYAGSQFPFEAYDNLIRQIVPRWTTTNDAIQAAYDALVDKVCPCVILVHSQSGAFGYQAALTRPDKVKALVIVEGTIRGDAATAAKLKNVPILVLYGDYVDKSPMFSGQRENNIKMAALAKAAGGSVEIVNLPEVGIRGNTHFMMMEKNNAAVADVIQKWLVGKGLVD